MTFRYTPIITAMLIALGSVSAVAYADNNDIATSSRTFTQLQYQVDIQPTSDSPIADGQVNHVFHITSALMNHYGGGYNRPLSNYSITATIQQPNDTLPGGEPIQLVDHDGHQIENITLDANGEADVYIKGGKLGAAQMTFNLTQTPIAGVDAHVDFKDHKDAFNFSMGQRTQPFAEVVRPDGVTETADNSWPSVALVNDHATVVANASQPVSVIKLPSNNVFADGRIPFDFSLTGISIQAINQQWHGKLYHYANKPSILSLSNVTVKPTLTIKNKLNTTDYHASFANDPSFSLVVDNNNNLNIRYKNAWGKDLSFDKPVIYSKNYATVDLSNKLYISAESSGYFTCKQIVNSKPKSITIKIGNSSNQPLITKNLEFNEHNRLLLTPETSSNDCDPGNVTYLQWMLQYPLYYYSSTDDMVINKIKVKNLDIIKGTVKGAGHCTKPGLQYICDLNSQYDGESCREWCHDNGGVERQESCNKSVCNGYSYDTIDSEGYNATYDNQLSFQLMMNKVIEG